MQIFPVIRILWLCRLRWVKWVLICIMIVPDVLGILRVDVNVKWQKWQKWHLTFHKFTLVKGQEIHIVSQMYKKNHLHKCFVSHTGYFVSPALFTLQLGLVVYIFSIIAFKNQQQMDVEGLKPRRALYCDSITDVFVFVDCAIVANICWQTATVGRVKGPTWTFLWRQTTETSTASLLRGLPFS